MSQIKCLVGDVLETSELLTAVKKVSDKKAKSINYGKNVRALTKEEIKTLLKNRNYSDDWKKVLVAKDFKVNRIAGSSFFGNCVIGVFKKDDIEIAASSKLPSGIYNSIIINSEIGCDSLIMNSTVSNYYIECCAVVMNVGTLAAKEGTNFGNGRELPIAIETGGREVKIFAEINIPTAEKISKSRTNKDLLKEYDEFIETYVKAATSSKGIVKCGAVLINTPKIENAFIGEGAIISNANLVSNSTILSNKEEKTEISDGAYVKNSLMQWGSEATSMAIVDKSVCNEHSHVERHGKVTESIIGPNTGVAEGECTASLLGPFVGFHHQSLIIAAMWPEGKGNVGYGANVGSNHTSKAPDQEVWCGEGTFFGLGVNIKFPSDFSKSPYSIIATAVNALPQKVEFPFSLINSAAERIEGVSPAYNEIFPAWVLSDNIFTVKRNEGKYIKRNKAKRTKFVFEVFRPDIVDLMIAGRDKLKNIKGEKGIYTDKDIKGIGKNFMSEESRKSGIEAYEFYIKYYALMGLKNKIAELLKAGKKDEAKKVLNHKSECPRWQHELKILTTEVKETNIKKNLEELVKMQEKIAGDVQISKEKDDKRGARIIPDYPEAHAPAKDDGFVKETWKITAALKTEIDDILKQIK